MSEIACAVALAPQQEPRAAGSPFRCARTAVFVDQWNGSPLPTCGTAPRPALSPSGHTLGLPADGAMITNARTPTSRSRGEIGDGETVASSMGLPGRPGSKCSAASGSHEHQDVPSIEGEPGLGSNSHGGSNDTSCVSHGRGSVTKTAMPVSEPGQVQAPSLEVEGEQAGAISHSTALCPSALVSCIPAARELQGGNSASHSKDSVQGDTCTAATSSTLSSDEEPALGLQRRLAMRRSYYCEGSEERAWDDALTMEETADEGSDKTDDPTIQALYRVQAGSHCDESSRVGQCASTMAWRAVGQRIPKSVSLEMGSTGALLLTEDRGGERCDWLGCSDASSSNRQQHMHNWHAEQMSLLQSGVANAAEGGGGAEFCGGEGPGGDELEHKLALIELYREYTQQSCALFLYEMDQAMQAHQSALGGTVGLRESQRRGGGGSSSSSGSSHRQQSRLHRMHGSQENAHGRDAEATATGRRVGCAARSVSADVPTGTYASKPQGEEGHMPADPMMWSREGGGIGCSPSHMASGDWHQPMRAGRGIRGLRARRLGLREYSCSERPLRLNAAVRWEASSPQLSQSLNRIELRAAHGGKGTTHVRRSHELRRQAASSPFHHHLSHAATCLSPSGGSPLKGLGAPSSSPLLEADTLYYSSR